MSDLTKKSDLLHEKALNIFHKLKIQEAFFQIGAEVNFVGSVATKLLMNNKDIDLHVYTSPFSIKKSFEAIALIASQPGVRDVVYKNLLDAQDKCLEWHLSYECEDGDTWQIDIIHILKDSEYAGYFEKVAAGINKILTTETREIILKIKSELKDKVPGILIYKAVLENNIKNTKSFLEWKSLNQDSPIIEWMPK